MNYTQNMGNECKCIPCTTCIVQQLSSVSAYDLIDHLLCNTYTIQKWIECADGSCSDASCQLAKTMTKF